MQARCRRFEPGRLHLFYSFGRPGGSGSGLWCCSLGFFHAADVSTVYNGHRQPGRFTKPMGFNVESMHPNPSGVWTTWAVLIGASGTLAAATPMQHHLTNEQVVAFAGLAMDGITREFPNKPSNVMVDIDSVKRPRDLHPTFYGSFDWHSSVHGHWLLVRLLKMYPHSPAAPAMMKLLDEQLTAENLAAEASYFDVKENRSFERMYGWAWTLRLVAELHTWEHAKAKEWAANLKPLQTRIVELIRGYLPRLTYPIRTGVHPDTAFALAQILDYARTVGDKDLEQQGIAYARAKYMDDRDYPAHFEPSGEDFFSPACNEADLMRRILSSDEFAKWLDQFLPRLGDETSQSAGLLQPAVVSDVTDPKIVHLAGLNLSRAWTQNGVLTALPPGDPRRDALQKSVDAHTKAGLDYVFSGNYAGEHWLATFAVYRLTDVGCE